MRGSPGLNISMSLGSELELIDRPKYSDTLHCDRRRNVPTSTFFRCSIISSPQQVTWIEVSVSSAIVRALRGRLLGPFIYYSFSSISIATQTISIVPLLYISLIESIFLRLKLNIGMSLTSLSSLILAYSLVKLISKSCLTDVYRLFADFKTPESNRYTRPSINSLSKYSALLLKKLHIIAVEC